MQRFLLFLACWLIIAGSFAQQYPFVYYTPKDGLVNSRVRGIKQGSDGRMYFFTYGGLSVYDGVRFTNYNVQDGLAHDLVNDIVEVAPDSFLIATNTTVLNTLVRGKVGIFKTDDNFCPLINRFLKSKNGQWYVAADDGLFLLSGNKFKRLPLTDKEGLNLGEHLDLLVEYKNFLLIVPWSFERRKFILYDKTTDKVADLYFKERIIDIAIEPDVRIWMSTTEGIKLIDTAALSNGVIKILPSPLGYEAIANRRNTRVLTDADSNTWFYGGDEVHKFSSKREMQVFSAREGLKTASLSVLFYDREGITWMASDGNGIVKMHSTNVQMLHSLSEDQPMYVTSIQHSNDTTWFYSLINRTIYRHYNNEILAFQMADQKIGGGSIYVAKDILYCVGTNKIICILNKNESSSYLRPRLLASDSVGAQYGAGILDPHGALIQYKIENGHYNLTVYKDCKKLMEYPISYTTDQMALDNKGRLWLVTRDNHLIVFSLHPDQPSKYLQLEKNFFKELPLMDARSITVDKNNKVWVGTRYKGVFCFTFSNMTLTGVEQFTTSHGLTDNFIYTLNCDNNNTVWVGTQTGLDKIFLKNGRYIIGNVSKSNNFFQIISKITNGRDNTVWALTSEGSILKVSPASSVKLSSSPPLLLTSVLVNDKPWDINITRFSYRENNLVFQVAAPSFTDERSIRYSYMLEGSANNTWSLPTNNASFNFINLSPGNYTLNMRAEFPDDMYPAQTLSYSFNIRPPWWQTWWFLSLMGLFFIGLLILGVRSYYRSKLEKQRMILEKQQAIEKERTRIASDMHDDLGAGLSTIRFLSEKVKRNSFSEVTKNDADKIVVNSNELVQKMNEIIWAMNEKNDTLEDLLFYTRSYAVEYCEENGLECTITLPENVPDLFVSGEIRRNVFLTVKESLHNVVKHANAKKVFIDVTVGNNLSVTIKDDGTGMNKNVEAAGNGLRNMQKRIESVNGKFAIINTNGVTIRMDIPLIV